MMSFTLNLARIIVNEIFRFRHFQNSVVKKKSLEFKDKKILEIGSGQLFDGVRKYSMKKYFDKTNEFIQSDVECDEKILYVDVTRMDYENKFDVILCLNVLEHVFEYGKAIKCLSNSLKPGGTLFLTVPFSYPLHLLPHDFWRFSGESLKLLFKDDFEEIEIIHHGLNRWPIGYFLTAKKKSRLIHG